MNKFTLDKEEFDWARHGHLVAIGAQEAIAIYSMKDSDRIILRQQDSTGDRDHVILVNADQAPGLIKALQDVMHARAS